MRLITGDECGVLKESNPELAAKRRRQKEDSTTATGHVIAKDAAACTTQCIDGTDEHMARTRGVAGLAWLTIDQGFACLRIDNTLEIYERTKIDEQMFGRYQQTARLDRVFAGITAVPATTTGPMHRPIGLGRASVCGNDKSCLCACTASGKVAVLQATSGQASVVQTFETVQGGNATVAAAVANPPVTAMAVQEARVALGGKERDVALYDLHTQQQLWKAKNLPPDPQTLLPPQVWPSCIAFAVTSSSSGPLGDNVMAVGSAYHEVRLYDIRAANAHNSGASQSCRRPMAVTPRDAWFEHRVTALTFVPGRPHALVVGDATGALLELDVRQLGKNAKMAAAAPSALAGRYVGPGGSIRALAHHVTLPRLAVVGLDRMLRVYDSCTRQLTSGLYLHQRINSVLMGTDGTWGRSGDDDGRVRDDDHDIDQDDVVRDYADSSDNDDFDDDDELSMPRRSSGQRHSEESNCEDESGSSQSNEDDASDDGPGGDDDDDDDISSSASDSDSKDEIPAKESSLRKRQKR